MCSLLPLLFSIVLKSYLKQCNDKILIRHQLWKGKLSLFADVKILYTENPKLFTKKLLGLINSKVGGYNIQKLGVFLSTNSKTSEKGKTRKQFHSKLT